MICVSAWRLKNNGSRQFVLKYFYKIDDTILDNLVGATGLPGCSWSLEDHLDFHRNCRNYHSHAVSYEISIEPDDEWGGAYAVNQDTFLSLMQKLNEIGKKQ